MAETFESAHLPWMQAVYGKRVLYEGGPIVPGFEHRWTSRSSNLPMNVARLCYPHVIGIGTDDLSDWFRYPWLRNASAGKAYLVPGGIVVQPRCIDGTWWLIAGRIRGRSEGLEGALDNRHYVQAHYLVQQVSQLGSWVLLDLPQHLMARPDVDGAPTDRNSIELSRWSDELLPNEWFETTKKWLFRLLSGQPVTVVDREMPPDRFYFQAILCLGCLPKTIRWRIPIGAGLYPINSDDVAIGHGTSVRTTTASPTVHDLETKATAYLDWLERLLQGVTTLTEVVTRVDDALSDVAALNTVPLPNETGRLDWRNELKALGGIADELNRLQKIREFVKNGGEIPVTACTQFKHFNRDAIVAVTDGLTDGDQSNCRAGLVLDRVLGKEWLPAWQELARTSADKTVAFLGIAAILGHEHRWECEFKWEWFNEFVSRIELPEKGDLQIATSNWLEAVSTGAHGVGSRDERKLWRRLLVEACNGRVTAWFTNWLKQNRLLARWLVYNAILNGSLVNIPGFLSKEDQLACKEVIGIVQCVRSRRYEPLKTILADIEHCFKGEQAIQQSLITMIKETAAAIAEQSKKNRQFAEMLLLQNAMRQSLPGIEQQFVDDIASRFAAFSKDHFIRCLIFNEWPRISDDFKHKISTHLALPAPYEYILFGIDSNNQPRSHDRLRKSDEQYLEAAIKSDVSNSTAKRNAEIAKRHTEITIRAIEKCNVAEDFRDFLCRILIDAVQTGRKLDSSRLGVFIGLLLLQRPVERLPSLSLSQAIQINEVLTQVGPDPRQKPGLLANVTSQGQMLAYLVGAARGEAFPSDTNHEVISDILDSVGRNTNFASFCEDQLNRIDALQKPLWRLFQIHSHQFTSNSSYNEHELKILNPYIKVKLKTDFMWVMGFVLGGWPIPSGLESQIARTAQNSIHEIAPNNAIELGMKLVKSCNSTQMSFQVLEFSLALATDMGKSNKAIRKLLEPNWKTYVDEAIHTNLLRTAITAGGCVSIVLLSLLWGWILKILPPEQVPGWMRPISPRVIENLAISSALIPFATMAIGIIVGLWTAKHGPLDDTEIGDLLSQAYRRARKFEPIEARGVLQKQLRAS